jgi:flavin reductase (DIM6/NTAB) family NADH-FMN oxidoreductase RutF
VDVGVRGTVGAATLVIGKIVCAHVSEKVMQMGNKNGWTKLDVLQPLARLGGNMYCGVKEPFSLNRPKINTKT